jgi:hypothetical protein
MTGLTLCSKPDRPRRSNGLSRLARLVVIVEVIYHLGRAIVRAAVVTLASLITIP